MSLVTRAIASATVLVVGHTVRAGAQAASPLHTGGWIISGGASIGRTHNNEFGGDVTHVGISPTGLVFVTSRFALGASVPLSYLSYSDPSGHSYSYGIGPAARYYFAADTSRWLPFVAASVQPQWQNEHRTVTIITSPSGTLSTSTIDSHDHLLAIDGSMGLTRLVAQHVGVTGELYYTNEKLSGDISPQRAIRSYDWGARFGLTVFVH